MCTLGLRLIVINVQCSTFFSNSEVFIRLYSLRVFAANNQFLSKHTRQPNNCFSENKQNCFEWPTICVNPASWSHQSLWETQEVRPITWPSVWLSTIVQPSPSTVSWDWPYFQCEEREEKKQSCMWHKLDPRESQTNLHLTKTNDAMSLDLEVCEGCSRWECVRKGGF